MKKFLSDNWEIILVTVIATFMLVIVCYAMAKQPIETEEKVEIVHTGKCLEYKTEYKLDCGLFVSKDSWCAERKYDVCVRWEEE